MAGASTHVVYTDDVGNAYRIKVPSWVATLTGATAATTQPNKPSGLKPRRRFARITASGRETSFVVPDIASAMYTDAFSTSVTLENGVFGSSGVAATLMGRTGEKLKAV